MKNKLTVLISLVLNGLVLLGVFLVFSFLLRAKNQGPVTIAAVGKSQYMLTYQQAVRGFNEYLKKENITANLKIYQFNPGDETIVRQIRSLNPTLILTLGTAATKFISEKITDIPIVFSMILDPWGSSITSKHIVGAALDVPAKIQLEYLKAVVPKLKRVGVVYNPSESEFIVREGIQAANELGFTLNTYPVNSTGEIPKIANLTIDALWIIPDSLVCQPAILKRILHSSIKERIPVIGFSRLFARAGALLALSCDLEDTGRQAGEIALRIVKGENYSRLQIIRPRKVKVYINKLVADRLGIDIPEHILKKAAEVFGK